MSLKVLIEDFAKAKTEFSEKAQEAMKTAFKQVFDNHPEITAIRWVQYTPYFNDGEPCEFSVHTPAVTNLPLDELSDLTSYGEYDGERDDVYTGSYGGSKDITSPYFVLDSIRSDRLPNVLNYGKSNQDIVELVGWLEGGTLEDVMEATFGDGVCVTATREGFDIEDHDHD